MKKINTILFIIITLALIGCSTDDGCKQNCATVVDVWINQNLPLNGDEEYIVKYVNECGDILIHKTDLDLDLGWPGQETQPIKRVYEGEYYCE